MGRPRSDCLALDTARCLALAPPNHTIPMAYYTLHHTITNTIPLTSSYHTVLPCTPHLTKVNPPASVIRRCHPQILFRQPEKSLFVELINSGADWHQVKNWGTLTVSKIYWMGLFLGLAYLCTSCPVSPQIVK